jgi:RNA polymerase sigma-70 factor (ECF subfamily)
MDDVEGAFTQLYRDEADRLYAYLCVRVSSPHLAEDLTGQVFLEAWRQRDRVVIDPAIGWGPWLFGVARNLALQAHRDQIRIVRIDPVSSQNLAVWGMEDDPAWTYEEREEHRQRVAAALTAIRQLADPDREVIELCVIGSLTPSQAAFVLDQPASTVRSRLTRARRRLRNLTNAQLATTEVVTP